ncbi:MAG: ATP-binding protein, partial [Lamprocystis purpurea]|nr:ATP-binding protein [Lamprocystis purpurea]
MSILEFCQPRADLLAGTLNPEIFTANLMQVIDHYRGDPDVVQNIYTDPLAFFGEGTYPTEGMRQVLRNCFGRLGGKDATYPAIQRMESAFGGGKTHTLIAATHLAFQGTAIADAAQGAIDAALLPAPGEVTVVGIAGDRVAIHETHGPRLIPYTLWGEIAFQIGGEALYQSIGPAASSFGSPGDAYFDSVFKGRKVLIMLDELAAYAARIEAARPGGRSSVATFLMSLFQYAKAHTGLAVILTLASQRDAFARQTAMILDLVSKARGQDVSKEEALGIARAADGEVRSVVQRDATAVVPVRGQEISRVLARRLFVHIDQEGAATTADAYMDMYRRTALLLPEQARQETYRERLTAHYPFHPTLIDYLTDKLATVESFQGTRGVLRVLALTVANLWRRQVPAPMIHTCHLDLRDPRLSDELVSRTESAELMPIINADIGGPDSGDLKAQHSNAALADRANPHPEDFPLHEYAWKTVFLHSLAGFGDGLDSNVFGIAKQDALFATAFPGMTPPQVETALDALRSQAYYLHYSDTEGRYYASTGVSINIVLAAIRRALRGTKGVDQLIHETSRKVVKPGTLNFDVIAEVELPERIPDKGTKPTLALIALDSPPVDPAQFITQAGANKPRVHQNLVFLLVPDTVEVDGEYRPGDDMLDNAATRALDLRERLSGIGIDVLARRTLKSNPAGYGLSEAVLSDQTFNRDTKEREQALLTVVTQAYRNLWYPGQGDTVTRREISTAGGEGGRSVIESIREVLLGEGKLVTAELAATSATAGAAVKLFFAANKDYQTLEDLRSAFACRRDWPVLEDKGVFETLIRAGIGHGAWCLFRMGSAEKPADFYARETGQLPLPIDLAEPGWCLVTPQGAKQRNWTAADKPDAAQVRKWVQEAIQQARYCSVT